MMKRYILFFCALLLSGFVQSQSKKELVEFGDAAFANENYGSAIYFYKRVISTIPSKYDVTYPYEVKSVVREKKKDSTASIDTKDSRKVYVLHRLAESYRLVHDYENAEEWYALANQNPTAQFPYTKYWYGVTLMNNEKYDEAEKVFEDFMNTTTDEQMKKMAETKMVSCAFAKNPENVNESVKVELMDSTFNRGTSAFGVHYFTDESVIFGSARKGNKVNDAKKEIDYYTTDLYVSTFSMGSYDKPTQFATPVNSPMNEGACIMSVDRQTIYFTRWSGTNKNDCAIYVSKRFNTRWMEPMKLDFNLEGYKTMQPMLNLDETKLFFSSNRPGGQGGMDIWYCPIDADGMIGAPVNLGPAVNTPEDEVSPFYHLQSSTLFFSSTGHRGFGGMDVFKTQYNEDEDFWSNPINIGGPVNTSKDETYYILDREQKNGFFTSDRGQCSDCDSVNDIRANCDKVYSFTKPELKFTISGYVYNAETDEVIPNALVELKDVNGVWEPIFLTTDDKGYYFQELQPEMEIFMKAKKTKFFADAATAKTLGLTESADLEQDFYLRPIPPEGEEIEIPGIEYDFDSPNLRPKSKEILDQLYDFLTLNDNLVVKIKSHTDARGADAYNMRLSQARAKSCVDYLISKGIKPERLIPQGYGETEPAPKLGEDKKPVKDDKGNVIKLTEAYINSLPTEAEREAAHQRNRRTAFEVLKQDFK